MYLAPTQVENTVPLHAFSPFPPSAAMLVPLAIKSTSIATSLLMVKVLGTVGIQGSVRFKTGFRPPEDSGLIPGSQNAGQNYGKATAAASADASEKELKGLARETRWVRIVQNDMENIPIGMIVMWGAALTPWSPVVHATAAGTFCAARYAHTVAYAKKMQPQRAIAWATGVIAVLTLGINGLVGAMML